MSCISSFENVSFFPKFTNFSVFSTTLISQLFPLSKDIFGASLSIPSPLPSNISISLLWKNSTNPTVLQASIPFHLFLSFPNFFFFLIIWLHQVLIAALRVFWLRHVVSLVVVQACGILVPRSGIKPVSPALQGGS